MLAVCILCMLCVCVFSVCYLCVCIDIKLQQHSWLVRLCVITVCRVQGVFLHSHTAIPLWGVQCVVCVTGSGMNELVTCFVCARRGPLAVCVWCVYLLSQKEALGGEDGVSVCVCVCVCVCA